MPLRLFASRPTSGKTRADDLFDESRLAIYRQTDYIFAFLLPLQWLAGIAAACLVSPRVWQSAADNSHLTGAIFVGGIIVLFPIFLVLNYPGAAFTRHIVAISQILMSGLLIHLTGGQLATHFHVFGSLVFLSFYRDWRVLLPATLITAADHLLRGWLFPFSIYGLSDESVSWRWLEHLGWILFTDVLLIISIRQSIKNMRETAFRTAALEAKEARYRAVVEQTDEAISLVELGTLRVLDCNPAFCRLVGCETIEEAEKLTAHDFNATQNWLEKYENWVEEQQSQQTGNRKYYSSGEKNYRRIDGTLVPVEVNVSTINYNGGDVYCVTAKDLTQRKKDEAELQRLAIVARKTQNAVIITDAEGCIEWVNEGFTTLTGYEFDEVVGNLGYILQGDETDTEVVETIRTTMWARKPFSGEIYNYTKDGKGFWMSISITPIFDDTGEVQGFIAVQMDVTERKAMEEELRRAQTELEQRVAERTVELLQANEAMQIEVNERKRAEIKLNEARQFLRNVIDSVPNMIFVKDGECRYTMANNATAELYGTTVEDIIGKTTGEIHHNAEESKLMDYHDRQVLESGREKFIAEKKLTGSDGNIQWLQIVKRPLFLGKNKTPHILGVATDLTERKLLENQLRHSQKLESIGQLAAGVAHEINTPTQYVSDNTRFIRDSFEDIGDILGDCRELIEAAKQGKLNSKMVETIEQKFDDRDIEFLATEIPYAVTQSLEGISRIGKIVHSMRNFSHPGAAEKKIANLNEAIESTVLVSQNEWKYFAEVETRFDEKLPPVPCLLDEINQVILNMIINATHSIADVVGDGTRGKGKITISTSRVDDWAEIRIADTGAGIPPEAQNRIFDPFFTTKEVGKGTGQGLAISHNVVVKKHKGQLTFETAPERGTTFIIRLPLKDQPNAVVV